MSVKFFNIKSRETREVDTEPMISAFWGSSDLGPNSRVGQDMGWRLAPEVVVRIKKIKNDEALMTQIAANYQIPRENLTETDILFHISNEDRRKEDAAKADVDYTDEYEQEIRDLEDKEKLPKHDRQVNPSQRTIDSVNAADDRAPIEKASGSVPGSDDKSVVIPKATVKAEEKKEDEVRKSQESSQAHEEGSVADGTAAHEEEQSLDDILADAKEDAAENSHKDAAAQEGVEDKMTTQDAIEEGRDQAEENTGVDLPESEPVDEKDNEGTVDQNAEQVAEQAEEMHEEAAGEEDSDTEVSEAYSRSRAELNKLAKSRGVKDPESFPNKDELAEAIRKAKA